MLHATCAGRLMCGARHEESIGVTVSRFQCRHCGLGFGVAHRLVVLEASWEVDLDSCGGGAIGGFALLVLVTRLAWGRCVRVFRLGCAGGWGAVSGRGHFLGRSCDDYWEAACQMMWPSRRLHWTAGVLFCLHFWPTGLPPVSRNLRQI